MRRFLAAVFVLGFSAFAALALGAQTLGTTISGGLASALTIGTTLVNGGTNARILGEAAGAVSEFTTTGSGTIVALQTSPAFATGISTPLISSASGALTVSPATFVDLSAGNAGPAISLKSGTASGRVLQWANVNGAVVGMLMASASEASVETFSAAPLVFRTDNNNTNLTHLTLALDGTNTFVGSVTVPQLLTTTHCTSAGGTCGSAASGAVSIAAAATTVTVATTAVHTGSTVIVTPNNTEGTALSVTCNTTIVNDYEVTAISNGVSFQITKLVAPVANPACVTYAIIN